MRVQGTATSPPSTVQEDPIAAGATPPAPLAGGAPLPPHAPPSAARGGRLPVGCATVNNSRNVISPLPASRPSARLRMRAGALSVLAAAAVAVPLAGCGSSGETGTISVGNENTADNSLVAAGPATPQTPKTGPLSKEPQPAPGKPPPPAETVTKDRIVGTGAEAKKGSTVYVNYVGDTFKTGTEFDSSWKRDEPFSFTVGSGQVIKGWDKGIVGMKVGGRRELIIPASEAYGSAGSGKTIPPNEALIFVIDLLSSKG